MRVGAKLRNYGTSATMSTVIEEARRAEAAGFDSVWVSDHVVMPLATTSRYPYAPGGRVDWDLAEPWLEAVLVLGAVAVATDRVSLGTAVLVASIREPVHLAKQLACVDQLRPGAVVLGVGDGWLREELELFGVDPAYRRSATEETLAMLRAVWGGNFAAPRTARGATAGRRYLAEPRPTGPVPVLLGGHSESVYKRVARGGYGWLPLASGERALEVVRHGLQRIAAHAEPGTSPPAVILNAGHAHDVAASLPALARLGVHEVLVDGEFERDAGPNEALTVTREALSLAVEQRV